MQLLTETTAADFAAFKSDFDAAASVRMEAGLTLLQMWREADAPGTVLCLFEVNDRARAESWLARDGHTGRFLETA